MEHWDHKAAGQENSLLDLPEGSDPWIAWLTARPGGATASAKRAEGRLDSKTLLIGALVIGFWATVIAGLWAALA